MTSNPAIRRLGPGDEDAVRRLATSKAPTRASELLADERTLFLAAFAGDDVVGFVLAYELVRRHGDPSQLFVYEIEVDESYRRCGVGTSLMRELERLAAARGIVRGFILTNESNAPAMALYQSLGGTRPHDDDVLWSFEYEAR